MSHLPRKGQYELFIYRGLVHCFDDPAQEAWKETIEMTAWLDKQSKDLCRAFRTDPKQNKANAYYLDPKLYFLWKLKWSEYVNHR